MGDYIKIHRSILDWEWYRNEHVKTLFLHMLIKANWKEGNFQGELIQRGSFVSSYKRLAEETDLTIDEVRTALKNLKKTGEVTSKSHSKYTVFTIKNYGEYQELPNQIPSSSHSIPKLFPTIEEVKKERSKEINKESSRFAPPTIEEVKNYCSERNNKINADQFVDFYSSKNWMVGKNKMKDWKAAVRTWERREVNKPVKKNSFNDFSQKQDYDFSSIEEKLLGRK